MSDKASIFSSNVTWVAGIVVAMGVSVYALVATGVLDGSEQAVEDESTTEISVSTTEVAPTVSEADLQTEVPVEGVSSAGDEVELPLTEDAAEPTIAPSFDVVRVDAAGNTVVAGAAAPGSMLGILLDGTEVALAPVDTAGKFAAILSIEPSVTPRVLSLIERREDGDVPSEATVIVAPIVAVSEDMVAAEVAETSTTDIVSGPAIGQDNLTRKPDTFAGEDVTMDGADTSTESGTLQVSNGAQSAEKNSRNDSEVAIDKAPKSEVSEETAAVDPAPELKTPAVIVSDSDGVRVIQPAASQEATPEVLAAVSIDSISYTDTGAVMVSGRGSSNAFVRLYLNNTLAATTQIDGAGLWSTQLDDVAGGLYELRADKVDESARVLSRVVTPFKRETPETVAKARSQAVAQADLDTQRTAPDAVKVPKTEANRAADVDAVATVSEANQADVSADKPETQAVPSQQAAEPAEPETEAADSLAEPAEKTEVAEAETTAAQPEAKEEAVQPVADRKAEATTEPMQKDTASSATTDAPDTTVVVATAQTETSTQSASEAVQSPVRIVTVQPGATLWAIARDRYGEGQLYLQVFEANKDKIRDPNLIYPGQVFTVPEE